MNTDNKIYQLAAGPALVTVFILLVPLLGTLFIDGWDWPPFAFFIFGTLLFSISLTYKILTRTGENKKGVIGGFVFGIIVGILFIVVLHKLYPREDIAGIVFITCLLSGWLFGFAGYLIQKYR